MPVLDSPSMHFRALVFGMRLIRAGDRVDALLKATATRPSCEPYEDEAGQRCERWRYSESGATTTFVVRSQRIVSIEQRVT